MSKARQDKPTAPKPKVANRRGRRDFHITEVVECGMELTGTEVKSLRAGQAKIDEAYAQLRGGELFLIGATISPYPQATPQMQHDPARDRRLLLHRRQIAKLQTHVRQKGKTIIALAIYFRRGWAKCELGLAVGKRQFDKRQTIKEREQRRDIARQMRRGKR